MSEPSQNITQTIDHIYPRVKQQGLDVALVQTQHVYPLIEKWQQSDQVTVEQVGESFRQQPIYKLTVGHGPAVVLGWSQMHGDEPTATAAIFDLMNFLTDPQYQAWNQQWQEKITLHLVPMLNPDGADLRTRQNAQPIDINRDARVLQSPEGRILDGLVKTLKPAYGFNLHDQRRGFTVGDSSNSAAMSFLAPAFDKAKNINDSRLRAMQLIVQMNQQIQHHICGHVGKYDDTWSYRCFGDAIAARDVSTILVESGGYPNDPNRQVARKMNFLSLVTALDSIANDSHIHHDIAEYEAIPMNKEDGCVDLVIRNLSCDGKHHPDYQVDALITGDKIDAGKAAGIIADIGDMRHQHGYHQLDAKGLRLVTANSYGLTEPMKLTESAYLDLLKQGVGYFTGDGELLTVDTELPVNLNPARISTDQQLTRDACATFFIADGEVLKYAVIKGQVIALI